MFTRNKSAFTLVELLVAMVVSSILIAVTVSTYSLFRRSLTVDQSRSDLSQNARVAMDRLSRELRQTPDIVTTLPASATDTTVAQPHEIEFEDGNAEDLTYRRYYLSGTTLRLDVKECFFSGQSTRVVWDSLDGSGNLPTCQAISGRTQDIAQSVTDFTVYGAQPITISITTADNLNQTFVLRTDIMPRNL